MYSLHLNERRTNAEKRKEMSILLNKALEGMLTKKQYECIQLYYMQGKTISETAQALGINKSTVSRHLAAAKQKLAVLNLLI